MRHVPPAVALIAVAALATGTRPSAGRVVERVVRGAAAGVAARRAAGIGTGAVPGGSPGADPPHVAPWAAAAVTSTAATGAGGAFRIEGLAAGVYWLTAVRDDGAQPRRVVAIDGRDA